nr:hypothetical protein [Oleomonas cavernae]
MGHLGVDLGNAAIACPADGFDAADRDDITAVDAHEQGRIQQGLDLADRALAEGFLLAVRDQGVMPVGPHEGDARHRQPVVAIVFLHLDLARESRFRRQRFFLPGGCARGDGRRGRLFSVELAIGCQRQQEPAGNEEGDYCDHDRHDVVRHYRIGRADRPRGIAVSPAMAV